MSNFHTYLSPFTRLILYCLLLQGCEKNQKNCIDIAPTAPYSNPVWHPDGQLLGFNRRPLKSISKDENTCGGYAYDYFNDSIGFWLINKNGTALKRVLTYQLLAPAWSPDGRWIAFCNNGIIAKMAFNGNNFDSAHIISLTNNSANNFFPSWSPTGDSIYYDSDADNTSKLYHIHKMAADGSGQTLIGATGIDSNYSREPYCTTAKQVLHVRPVNDILQVFSMDVDGKKVRQITTNPSSITGKEYPKEYNGKVFFEDSGLWCVDEDGSGIQQLCSSSAENFSISKDGVIAYVNYDGYGNLDKTTGTIWLMDSVGQNKKPLTFNNY